MSRRVVEEAERGRGALTVRALDALLGACDRTLAVEPRAATGPEDPDMVRTVRAHLHLSLAARLGRVLGAPLSLYPGAGSARWRGLCALARTRGPLRVVRGPVAVGLWVPGIVLGKGTRPPLVLSGQPLGSLRREYPLWHLDLANSQPADRLVPIPVPGARRPVLVAVPEAVAAVEPEDAPALRIAARLLHEEGRRDAAARRVPPHREGDPWREADYLRQNYRAAGLRGLPSATDFRAWRLGAPGSMSQEIGRRGLVAYPPSLEWSSWGW